MMLAVLRMWGCMMFLYFGGRKRGAGRGREEGRKGEGKGEKEKEGKKREGDEVGN